MGPAVGPPGGPSPDLGAPRPVPRLLAGAAGPGGGHLPQPHAGALPGLPQVTVRVRGAQQSRFSHFAAVA